MHSGLHGRGSPQQEVASGEPQALSWHVIHTWAVLALTSHVQAWPKSVGPLLVPAQPQDSGVGRRYPLTLGDSGFPWAGVFLLGLSTVGSVILGVLVMRSLRPCLPGDMNPPSYLLFCLDFGIVEGYRIRALWQHRLLQPAEPVLVIFSLQESQHSTVP